jgi:hypothetical protein
MNIASSFGCIVTDFNVYWSAVLADYDGAPDATGTNSLIGHGKTEDAAVADLLDKIRDFETEST